MGTEPVDLDPADARERIAAFCREIEAYLCRKNDGHLIRVVGPSFTLVSGWAERGVPIKVAFEGIDRCFERYYRKEPRRRPLKIDFCEADVLDVFDEWRRATGLGAQTGAERPRTPARPSLPDHLERVLTRLTDARATGALGADAEVLIDRVAAELEAARAKAGGLRGAARTGLIGRLNDIDRDLLRVSRERVDPAVLAGIAREAEAELAPFRVGLTPDAYARARDAAVDRLLRARLNLPTIVFD